MVDANKEKMKASQNVLRLPCLGKVLVIADMRIAAKAGPHVAIETNGISKT